MNKVILIGRLTRNPKIRCSQGEETLIIAKYTLAVTKKFKKKDDEVDFINCVAFGKLAEIAEKYLSKGKMICVVGRLQTRSWDENGQKHWITEIIVDEYYFVEPKVSKDNNKDLDKNDISMINEEDLPF